MMTSIKRCGAEIILEVTSRICDLVGYLVGTIELYLNFCFVFIIYIYIYIWNIKILIVRSVHNNSNAWNSNEIPFDFQSIDETLFAHFYCPEKCVETKPFHPKSNICFLFAIFQNVWNCNIRLTIKSVCLTSDARETFVMLILNSFPNVLSTALLFAWYKCFVTIFT